jgi:hypothetical protein
MQVMHLVFGDRPALEHKGTLRVRIPSLLAQALQALPPVPEGDMQAGEGKSLCKAASEPQGLITYKVRPRTFCHIHR